MARKVAGLRPAPLYHGRCGIIEGVEGGGVILLPAAPPQRTAPADPAGRPVKDGGDVVVVPGGLEGRPQGVPQGAEGPGGGLQLLLHQLLGTQVGRPRGVGRDPDAQAAQGTLGQEQKGDGGQKGLIQNGHRPVFLPAPEHRGPVGQHVDQGEGQPAAPPEQPGNQAGEAQRHGVHGGAA